MVHRFTVTAGDSGEREVVLEALAEGRFRLTVDGQAREVDARRLGATGYSLLIAGASYRVDVEGNPPEISLQVGERALSVRLLDRRRQLLQRVGAQRGQRCAGLATVRAPMPGKVVKVLVAADTQVKAGAGLVVVEAMKMENELRAPHDGLVREVAVREGQAVEAGERLVTIE
jgi:biotin carboxyl carrier protein